ncbi:MAG: cell division ATP-binding protein FtsE [Clostridia bacterium]|nr:MAG: cell division ATP-binding protein FtsE [Clostridia bacterium]
MIQFYNVTKIYPTGVYALRDCTAGIEKGEFVFLVGPSGAGKSTFLRLIFREELATRGQVLVGGRSVSRLRPREVPLLRRQIGVVFQDFRLLEDRTVYENVAFAMQVLERPSKEIRQRVPRVLQMVGLAARANIYPQHLSGGEQQRVAIARAIINTPPILVADEPTGNLDPDTAWDILQLLLEINKGGTTVIIATHNREIVDRLQRRVIALGQGRILRDEAKGVYRREA